MNINEQAIAALPCPLCEQPAGQPCVAPINGRALVYAHTSRQFALRDLKPEEKD